jgi:hypothetical protein
MKWDFTPEDVRSGNVDYSVVEFREDLLDEILFNIADFSGDDMTKGFYSIMTIILCTSLAFGRSSDSVIASLKKYFSTEVVQKLLTNKELLEEIKEDNKENIKMLRAVIHRRMRDDVEKGLTPGTVAKTITAELMDFR